jgi:hypothetical protein
MEVQLGPSLSGKPSGFDTVSWSEDGMLSICTDSNIHVVVRRGKQTTTKQWDAFDHKYHSSQLSHVSFLTNNRLHSLQPPYLILMNTTLVLWSTIYCQKMPISGSRVVSC